MKEFPISNYSFFGKTIIFSGGGYFRILPYSILKTFAQNSDYVMSYFHPSDFDPGQPSMKHLSLLRRWKNEIKLEGAFKKFQKYTKELDFVNIAEADKLIDWSEARNVILN